MLIARFSKPEHRPLLVVIFALLAAIGAFIWAVTS